ncbi:MAG TPA: 2,3-bisphosphoglycerate-independent phosphoglycerate mutase [Bacillota bacterium]|jgi:2,3-bisphosphoglycerate-independent phosphoglycerate mutase|nr:2,3-bisphosphoglycerate-independent phosphoglycerate mutase [Bacillota bacterium]HOL09774.1 2,3-bisphosphoglycerate-independent phosphoglycerate mutase [Bacillota bacterium]HPO97320.1 2,3-bisphosphoglycerate-independent phosphoglycerate mutase [Bacillota bacterium]
MGYRPTALFILDGWGENPNPEANAIKQANTPFLDSMFAKYPHATLLCSGEAVGLPEGQMGTSEVGHLNIGAGRVVYQSLVRISKALRDGEFKQNKVFLDLINYALKADRPLHLMGLVSPGGVHSHTEHLYGLIQLAKDFGIKQVYIHAFLDGRDTPPSSAAEYLEELEQVCREKGLGKVATIHGRYYAMDRDKRWDRVEKAYAAMVYGEGEEADSSLQAIQNSYQNNVTDEFVLPTIIKENGKPVAVIEASDPVIFFNFRPDRAREITRAFVDPDFDGFFRKNGYLKPYYVCMTQYDETLNVPLIFPPEEKMKNILSEVLANNGLKQLRIAETEKYAHVTFFFNGGEETPYPLEDRILIPSPKVATYDLKPEMSAPEVTERLLQELNDDKYDVIIANYANCDMVGHTGVMKAAQQAVETVDQCLAKVVPVILEKGGAVIITADHGNAEMMEDYQTHEPYTAHTTFPVPVIVAGVAGEYTVKDGGLSDLAPTVLDLLGIEKPVEMTGNTLIVRK